MNKDKNKIGRSSSVIRIEPVIKLPAKTNSNRFSNPRLINTRRRKKPLIDLQFAEGNQNKRCAIVGNAASIFDVAYGYNIDTCDVVVRINTPLITSQINQGSKTDVIFVHDMTENALPQTKFPLYKILNVYRDSRELFDYWSSQIQLEVSNPRARPSTGFIAIVYMLQLNYKIELFGFDWYATPTYYTKNMNWKYHFPEWEKIKITSLLNL